jgi:hypothetical protein
MTARRITDALPNGGPLRPVWTPAEFAALRDLVAVHPCYVGEPLDDMEVS